MNSARMAIFLTSASVSIFMGTDAVAQDINKDLSKKEIATGMSVLDRIIEPYGGLDKDVRVRVDSISESDMSTRYTGLTEEDFVLVAEELGVETAAIKAVVAIEAGVGMKGFWAPGVPVINFDSKMYARYKSKAGSGDASKEETVPEGLSGYALKEWTQLVNARKINARCANLGTFWGMFQIGGFNYKKCGCETVDEFVRLMSYSELEQLELFAAFIINGGMVADLRNKNWAAFARKYNGPGYARRGYHTKMAAAYKKYKAAENQQNKKQQ